MPKGGYNIITKQDLVQRLKEHDERAKQKHEELLQRVKAFELRKKYGGELKNWMAKRKLLPIDLLAMYREMKPKRADAPAKSKKALKPTSGRWADKSRHSSSDQATDMFMKDGKLRPKRGDPAFRRAIHEKRTELGVTCAEIGKKVGVSDATISNWESGRNVPKEDQRVKVLTVLGLPEELGKEATAAMVASFRGQPPNGHATTA